MKNTPPFLPVFAFLVLAAAVTLAHAADDWPCWRGPNRDGLSSDTGLLTQWDGPPPLAWKAENLGIGYSGVSIVRGKVFTMGERDGQCQIIALDAEKGQELWSADVGKSWEQGGYKGPRCTPTYDDGLLYAVVRTGRDTGSRRLTTLDPLTGVATDIGLLPL